ncbi:MAG: hypothetical protein HUU50_01045 [Candidatus Brocadiae bacterium]|nr:hypothetical protein [Candidatus Brocadiia bacterium]
MGKKVQPSQLPSVQVPTPYPKDTEFLQTLGRADQKEGIQSLIRLQNSLLSGISSSLPEISPSFGAIQTQQKRAEESIASEKIQARQEHNRRLSERKRVFHQQSEELSHREFQDMQLPSPPSFQEELQKIKEKAQGVEGQFFKIRQAIQETEQAWKESQEERK